jgi:hypothetical protein
VEAAAIINTMSEFILAALPLLAVFPLGVDKRRRWAATSLLSLGFVVAFTGCFRCYYLWKLIHSHDLTWWSDAQWICSQVENDLALVSRTTSLSKFGRLPTLTRMLCT